MLPNDVIVLRNNGEDHEVFGGRLGGGNDQTGRPRKPEAHNIPSSSLPRSPEAAWTKTNA
jgi:hypothetical protein